MSEYKTDHHELWLFNMAHGNLTDSEILQGFVKYKLAFGTVGFRFSTKLVLPKEIKPVIEALRRNGMMDCLNQTVTVNKEVLKTYAEEQIVEVGGSLKKEDTFWYEVDRESVQDK